MIEQCEFLESLNIATEHYVMDVQMAERVTKLLRKLDHLKEFSFGHRTPWMRSEVFEAMCAGIAERPNLEVLGVGCYASCMPFLAMCSKLPRLKRINMRSDDSLVFTLEMLCYGLSKPDLFSKMEHIKCGTTRAHLSSLFELLRAWNIWKRSICAREEWGTSPEMIWDADFQLRCGLSSCPGCS